MPDVTLTIDDLKLDEKNPRSPPSKSQREALQKVLDDQEEKLAELAESIVEERRLNPMDRMLVVKASNGQYTVLEGNRRTAALRILLNPSVLTGLTVKRALQKRLEEAASDFDRKWVEPISAFEVKSRDEANYWLRLRHTGENEGRGIVGWSTPQQGRFKGGSPELQAVDFVRAHGNLTEEQIAALEGRFITTVKRLLDAPAVRRLIGVQIQDGKLLTDLPPDQVIKPLKKIVLDLALKRKKVTALKLTQQMEQYVKTLPAGDLPDLSKKGELRAIDDITGAEFKPKSKAAKKRGSDPSERKTIVPKSCTLDIPDNRIAAIYKELRKLKFGDADNAIAVLFRVFFEMSVDAYMRREKIPLEAAKHGGGTVFKALEKKVGEVAEHMIANGAEKKMLVPMLNGLHNKRSPLWIDLLHAYVHNSFATPTRDNLVAAWDHTQPFFEHAWP